MLTLLIIFASLNKLTTLSMTKNVIQEQRMRGYFIQATKELLKGEGLKALSVRSIAGQAGYSYATMYNYFRDVKDLVFECVKDFQQECENQIFADTATLPDGFEKMKAILKSYVRYFVQYPGVFELFFIEKPGDIGSKQPTLQLIWSFTDKVCNEAWDYCLSQNLVTPDKAALMKDEIRFLITGMLLFYLNRRLPEKYVDFMVKVDEQLNGIFGG